MSEKIQELSDEIQEASLRREERQAAITAVKEALEAAKAKNVAELEVAKSVGAEAKQAEAAAAEAAIAVKACEPAIAKAQAAEAQAIAAAEAFASGPRAYLDELLDRQAPQEDEGDHQAPAEPADGAALAPTAPTEAAAAAVAESSGNSVVAQNTKDPPVVIESE